KNTIYLSCNQVLVFRDLILVIKGGKQYGLTKREEKAESQCPPKAIDQKAIDQRAGQQNNNSVNNHQKEPESDNGNGKRENYQQGFDKYIHEPDNNGNPDSGIEIGNVGSR